MKNYSLKNKKEIYVIKIIFIKHLLKLMFYYKNNIIGKLTTFSSISPTPTFSNNKLFLQLKQICSLQHCKTT